MLSRKIAQLLQEGSVSVEAVTVYLREHGLIGLLPYIKKHLEEIRAKEIIKNTLVIESPFPLSDTALASVREIVGGGEEVRVIEKKELLAGFVARFQNKEYDASAKTVITNFIRN